MGKTFRRNGEDGCGKRREKRDRRRAVQREEGCWEAPEAVGILLSGNEPPLPKPSKPTPEERAVKKIGRHIVRVLKRLAQDGYIKPYEIEDEKSIIDGHITRLMPTYEKERVPKSGKPSSLLHFLYVIVDNYARNIRKKALNPKHYHKDVAILSPAEDEEALPSSFDAVTEDNMALSDRCRSVRNLDFAMDVHTLVSKLTVTERMCLRLRMEGYTNSEIAAAINVTFLTSVNRLRVERTLFPRIQRKARLCGFFPPSETNGCRKNFTAHFAEKNCIGNTGRVM